VGVAACVVEKVDDHGNADVHKNHVARESQ
jgi:hypothetical protein